MGQLQNLWIKNKLINSSPPNLTDKKKSMYQVHCSEITKIKNKNEWQLLCPAILEAHYRIKQFDLERTHSMGWK